MDHQPPTRNDGPAPRGAAFVGGEPAVHPPSAVAEAAALMKALAHEGRLEILCCLIEGEKTVGDLEKALGLRQTTVSQQLMRLRLEELVSSRREGRNIYYSLERPEIRDIITVLRRAFCAPEETDQS